MIDANGLYTRNSFSEKSGRPAVDLQNIAKKTSFQKCTTYHWEIPLIQASCKGRPAPEKKSTFACRHIPHLSRTFVFAGLTPEKPGLIRLFLESPIPLRFRPGHPVRSPGWPESGSSPPSSEHFSTAR